jgi:hypothetical protein
MRKTSENIFARGLSWIKQCGWRFIFGSITENDKGLQPMQLGDTGLEPVTSCV